MIGHHFSISVFCQAACACGVLGDDFREGGEALPARFRAFNLAA
jgi:hypothetical protein